MFEVESIIIDHNDVIHDVAFDYYGRRMATSSSDHTVKVWDEDETGKHTVTNSWKAHSGSVWRISWAHPEFGQVLATCSFDRTVAVWEEIAGEKVSAATAPARRWVKRTTLVDSRTSVCDVEFAPKYLGLLLATASSDGIIRIYEAPDIMNLSQWPVQHEITNDLPLSCLSWNTSIFQLPSHLLAAGSNDSGSTTGKVFLYGYNENIRKCNQIESLNDITDPVTDLAFAPAKRTFHILAVASKDLYIVNIRGSADDPGNTKLDIQTQKFIDHNCQVWRVAWNMLGSILISSGDDGCVRIWRMNYSLQWRCTTVLKSEGNTSISLAQEPGLHTANFTAAAVATAKYYKKGTISNSNQVPWH